MEIDDQAKRPLMAEVAAKALNKVIFTADNPRDEDPENIIDEMEKGCVLRITKKPCVLAIENRPSKQLAWNYKPEMYCSSLGKAMKATKEIKGERLPFDDYATVKRNL